MERLRDLMVLSACGAETELVELSGPTRQEEVRRAGRFDRHHLADQDMEHAGRTIGQVNQVGIGQTVGRKALRGRRSEGGRPARSRAGDRRIGGL